MAGWEGYVPAPVDGFCFIDVIFHLMCHQLRAKSTDQHCLGSHCRKGCCTVSLKFSPFHSPSAVCGTKALTVLMILTISENHHIRKGPWCDLVVSLSKGGEEKCSFKHSLLLNVMATRVSLELWTWSEGVQELSLALASHGLLCHSVVTGLCSSQPSGL